MKAGGGWKAIWYSLKLARRAGFWNMFRAASSRNACKTCALGMGGQLGGMVNEGGHFPEVCKKSFQAMASDLQAGITSEFFQRLSIPALRTLSPRELEMSGRLVQPMFAAAGDPYYRPITWDDAFARIADKLRQHGPTRSFFYASGRSSNEAGFLLQLFSRQFGTNYVNNCSYFCHQASGVGLGAAIGAGTGTVRLEDLDQCDLYILIGGNPASNHPRLMRTLMQIRRRGGEVIVVNPAREVGLVKFRVPSDVRSLLFGSPIASQYIQPHIGGDIALLAGVCKLVVESNELDTGFIAEATEAFEAFRDTLSQISWGDIEQQSGVTRREIRFFAESYLKAKNVVFGWTMGITHHLHGVENVQMIANLALLRGMVGRPHAGFMPIRGHSNVQGIGSVGVTPHLKLALLKRFEEKLGFEIPKTPGLDTMACLDAAHRGEMGMALCLGGNLYGSAPDAKYAEQAIAKLDFIAYLSTTLNTGHAWGQARESLILPVLPRDEEPEPTTQESMFSYVRLSAGGKARYPGPRSEVSILTELGKRLLGNDRGVDWSKLASHQAIRELIASLIPELEGLATIAATKKEFHIPGRAILEKRFPTPTGKAKFHAVGLPGLPPLAEGELRLMTIRSEGQFNTVVYDDEDIYRGQERRDVILMHPDDIAARGWKTDQLVTVRSVCGEMPHIRVRPFDVRRGNAMMYCPEANVLVPKAVDPLSKTPAFKSVVISLHAE